MIIITTKIQSKLDMLTISHLFQIVEDIKLSVKEDTLQMIGISITSDNKCRVHISQGELNIEKVYNLDGEIKEDHNILIVEDGQVSIMMLEEEY